MFTCYCPQRLDLPENPQEPGNELAASLIVADVNHGTAGCVPVEGHKPRKHEALTEMERAALKEHGFPWALGYWPTIRIEKRDGKPYTPSCTDVPTAEAIRTACVKLGIGYFDGNKTHGRKI